jgi:A/G-specific adenine glycosylase
VEEQFYKFNFPPILFLMKIRKEKIVWFEERLADFFQKAGREHLPWRKKRMTAYEVWVSEIMLQQTQVVRVIGYYMKFLKKFPTVEALARATWEEFLPYYEGLGYYNRGRNMLKAARMVVDGYDGKFPRDRKLLEKIPGIGPYTAAAIMSFAYGDNHLAWDTNLYRVIGRFFYGGKQLVADEAFWEDKFAMPKKEMNAALMDFGSGLCVSRPKCEACSLKTRCRYYKEQGVQEAKKKIQKKSQRDWSEAAVSVFLHENHKKYFSANEKTYEPFILPKGYNTRAGIKKYFLEKYGLTLAVRPPHEKKIVHGQLMIFVNAQILLGNPVFSLFPKSAVERYNRIILEAEGRKS